MFDGDKGLYRSFPGGPCPRGHSQHLAPCRPTRRLRRSMLNKVIDFISGNLHKDSRTSSPARSPKALQTAQGAPAVVRGTANNHAASTAATPERQQQQQLASAGHTPLHSNGAATVAAANPAVEATCNTSVQPQLQREHNTQADAHDAGTASTEDGMAAPAVNGLKPASLVPPLAPGTVLRTSSAGSTSSTGNLRKSSLLGDAGRATSRSFLQQQQQQQQPPPQQLEQQQQQPPARPVVTLLPLHLVSGGLDSPAPPSVGAAQAGSPEPPQQQPQQPFWQGSNWSFGSHCEQNKRQHMEDRFAAADLTGVGALAAAQRAGFFAVYDGHSGHEAAEYLEANLQSYILAAGPEALAARPLEVLSAAVQQMEREIVANYLEGHGSDTAGSTLCAVLLVDDKLHVAHVGDSRAVLGRGSESIQLTRDHKPQCRIEAARIEADDPEAEITGDGYMYGELAVARAIGSAAWKRDPSRRALIPTPDLVSIQLQPEDDFVLLATDGLWDKVDNAEAVSVTRRSLSKDRSATTAARALIERAQRKDSTDNITVVTLLLHGRAIALPKSNSMLFRRSALPSSVAAAAAGGDSPPGCSTPCSGASTPASGATPRCCTPNRPVPLASTASAPASAVAAAAAAAASVSPARSLPQQLPPVCPSPSQQQ